MPRFFCETIKGNNVFIHGEDAKHIVKVLRLRVGDSLTINDLHGTDYMCEIVSLGETVVLDIKSSQPNETELGVDITLYQAFPKGDKFEFIVQKAVELGVTSIVPMMTKRCVARPDEKSFEKKRVRYQKIALEAAKQSGRGIIPQVSNIISFEQAILNGKNDCSVLYYEGGGKSTHKIVNKDKEKVNIYIGSEGGFSEDEVKRAVEHGIQLGTLGKLILRCETAPIVAMTLVLQAENII